MTQWYKRNSLKLTYAEYWRVAPNLRRFLYVSYLKATGRPLDFKHGLSKLDHLIRCDISDFGSNASKVNDFLGEASAHGFQFQFCYTIPQIGMVSSCSVAMLSEDGRIVAQPMFAQANHGQVPRVDVLFNCISRREDGNIVCTTDQPRKFNSAPFYDTQRLVGGTPKEIIALHRKRLNAYKFPILPIAKSELEPYIVSINNKVIDYWIDCGLAVPMTDEEVLALQK